MNETVRIFLERQGINIYEIKDKVDIRVLRLRQIDETIDNYGITGEKVKGNIPICRVLGCNGFDDMITENIFENLGNYFNDFGNGYQIRSLSMLEYQTDEVVEKLRPSFSREPIVLREVLPNKYIVDTNGMHRYHVLRIHYLKELSQSTKSPIELFKLNKKYTIPVEIITTDYLKTYCNFLLNQLLGKIQVEKELNNSFPYKPTGKTKVYPSSSPDFFIFDDNELIIYVIDQIQKSKFKPYIMEIIQKESEKSEIFKAFYETYLKSALEGTKEVDPNGIYQSKQ